MSRAAELVERALAAARRPTIAYVTERSEANLRWAGSALTTNGEMTSTELTVVATTEVDGGTGVGTVSQQVTDASQVAALVAAAELEHRPLRPPPCGPSGGAVGPRGRLRSRTGGHHDRGAERGRP